MPIPILFPQQRKNINLHLEVRQQKVGKFCEVSDLADDESVIQIRLRASLKEAGVSLAEAGGWLGISNQAMHGYVSGRSAIRLEDAAVIADKLGLSLDWLAGRTDSVGQQLTPRERAVILALRMIEKEGPEDVISRLEGKRSDSEEK